MYVGSVRTLHLAFEAFLIKLAEDGCLACIASGLTCVIARHIHLAAVLAAPAIAPEEWHRDVVAYRQPHRVLTELRRLECTCDDDDKREAEGVVEFECQFAILARVAGITLFERGALIAMRRLGEAFLRHVLRDAHARVSVNGGSFLKCSRERLGLLVEGALALPNDADATAVGAIAAALAAGLPMPSAVGAPATATAAIAFAGANVVGVVGAAAGAAGAVTASAGLSASYGCRHPYSAPSLPALRGPEPGTTHDCSGVNAVRRNRPQHGHARSKHHAQRTCSSRCWYRSRGS